MEMAEEKWKQQENSLLLPYPCKLQVGNVVAGSYSLCGLRIKRDGDSPDQNTIVVKLWWWC